MVITDDDLEPATGPALLSRARAGEADAFCRLVEPLQARLLRQATALCGDANAAEDLVSETLVGAWKGLTRYDGTCRLSTWLYAILLHRWQKSVRRARCRPVPLAALPPSQAEEWCDRQENLPSPEPSPGETAARNDVVLHLMHCIERLPKKHRQVILLRFFEDASLLDIARVMGCGAGTVKSRLYHALEKLRQMKMNLPDLRGDTQP